LYRILMRIFRIQLAFRRLTAVFVGALLCNLCRAQWGAKEKAPAAADKAATADKAISGDKAASAEKSAAADKSELPPLPAPAHAQQSMELNGKTLRYTVTVGALPVRNKDGKTAGEVVLTALYRRGRQPPGDLCHEWRAGRFFGVFELWRHRTQAFTGRQ